MFKSYLIAIGGDTFSNVRQQHVLLHNLGIEYRKVFNNLNDPEQPTEEGEGDFNVYLAAMNKLEKHFGQAINVGLERQVIF